MFNPSREEVRKFFRDAWAGRCAGQVLEGNALIAAGIVAQHPEYHSLLEASEAHADLAATMQGQTPPYLHLSLHLAVEEQLRIDQPPGIRACYLDLLARLGSEHDSQHAILECLGEVLWEAQRQGGMPDSAAYLARLRRRCGSRNDKAG